MVDLTGEQATVLAVAFAAGGYVAALAQVMRHVNGIGRKYGRICALLVAWADTEEKRKDAANLIAGK